MPIIGLIKTVLGILLWFLKRRDTKAHEEWVDDLGEMDKALAKGDDGSITNAFERLRRKSNSG